MNKTVFQRLYSVNMHSFLFRNLSHPERNIYLGTALSMHTPDKTKLHLFSGFNLVYYISSTVCYIYVQFAQYTVRV